MIESFVVSWPLFQHAYLSGWGIAFLLSVLGVWVVARDQIFLGAAVAQTSTLGVAVVLWLSTIAVGETAHLLASHPARSVAAVLFALAATVVTSRGGRGRESHEAITGWVYLTSSATATLVLARSPHGLEEIEQLMTSSLIGATAFDVVQFALFAAIACVCVVVFRGPLVLLAIDSEMATAVGLRSGRWLGALAMALGISVGLAIHVAGTLYTFGCLVLPALAARSLAREVRQMLWISPLIGVSASVVGFVVANGFDLPPAQVTIALLSAVLVASWLARRVHG